MRSIRHPEQRSGRFSGGEQSNDCVVLFYCQQPRPYDNTDRMLEGYDDTTIPPSAPRTPVCLGISTCGNNILKFAHTTRQINKSDSLPGITPSHFQPKLIPLTILVDYPSPSCQAHPTSRQSKPESQATRTTDSNESKGEGPRHPWKTMDTQKKKVGCTLSADDDRKDCALSPETVRLGTRFCLHVSALDSVRPRKASSSGTMRA